MRAEKFRILPALDKSVEFAQKNGWITEADMATVAHAFCLAGVIDNMADDSKELATLSRQLQVVLDRLALSVAGRDDKPSITDEVTPLDRIKQKQIDWVTTAQDINYTNNKPN
jgi:hypothetical protein